MTTPPGASPCHLYVIAGPNGSGKSTFTLGIRALLTVPIIDPDEMARLIRPDAPEMVAIDAGRRVIELTRTYIAIGQSFTLETTLAGNAQLRLMEQAKNSGYEIEFVYVGVDDADICIGRVEMRVAKGGHSVPPADVRRRFQRSLAHLPAALRLADHATIYDNSTQSGHREVLVIEHGQIVAQESVLPPWVTRYLGSFLAQLEGY